MSKPIRIAAAIGAIILIIFLLFVTMALTGNPISKALATRTANKYVRGKYADLDLNREETYYNFKDGSYNVKYANKKSKDLHFTISTDYLGRLYYDGYERDVISKWNTRLRLDQEYRMYLEKLIRDNLDYDYSMILPSSFADEKDEGLDILEIDMPFDIHSFPFEGHLTIYIYEENRTWERLSEVILEINEFMEKEGIDIAQYSIILQEKVEEGSLMGDSTGVYNFPSSNLNSENLPKVLEEFFKKYNDI